VFNTSIVSTCEPENVQTVLALKFQDYDLGPLRRDAFADVIGKGIFTSDGEEWAHFRQQLRPQFNRDQISDLESTGRHVQILFKALPEEDAQGWIEGTDLMPYIFRFTMDVSTEFLFGHSVDTQSRTLHSQDSGNTEEIQEDLEFTEAITFASEYTAWRLRFGPLYWLVNSKKYKTACATVERFADRFVNLALNPDHKGSTQLHGKERKFVLLDELVSETRDPAELRNQVLHVMLAGRETTASLLSFVLLLVSRHPNEFKKLREAVISHFGTEISPTNEITFSSIKACKPINNFMYETLRLYPLVPMNGRRALRDTTLPAGGGPDRKQPIAIRKGEQVGFPTYVIHRRKDIWGEDADDFRPDRWINKKLGWEMGAFGGGPRVCLGQQFALNEVGFVLVRFLQRYDRIEAVDTVSPLKKKLSITLGPANGQKIKLHRATS
jgi:cytochrome P450